MFNFGCLCKIGTRYLAPAGARYTTNMNDYRIILLHHLNWIDCVASLLSLGYGVPEANPFMAEAYEHGPQVFVVVKMLVAALAIEILNRQVHRRKGWVLTGLVALFSSVCLWHVFGLLMLFA